MAWCLRAVFPNHESSTFGNLLAKPNCHRRDTRKSLGILAGFHRLAIFGQAQNTPTDFALAITDSSKITPRYRTRSSKRRFWPIATLAKNPCLMVKSTHNLGESSMKNKDTKLWKVLAAIYMAYSITADIILLCGLVWLIASGGI